MKNNESVQVDSKTILTPSVAAFFASVQSQSCGLSSGLSSPQEQPIKESQLSKAIQKSKVSNAKNERKAPARDKSSKTKNQVASDSNARMRVQSDSTPQTPKSSEKYAGSSFHRSPAAHTLPIPAFAKTNENSFCSDNYTPKSLPSQLDDSLFHSNDERMDHSRNLMEMLKLSSHNKHNHEMEGKNPQSALIKRPKPKHHQFPKEVSK